MCLKFGRKIMRNVTALWMWYDRYKKLSPCSSLCLLPANDHWSLSFTDQIVYCVNLAMLSHSPTVSYSQFQIKVTGCNIQGDPKLAPFLYALTLPNINRFSKLFHCQNQQKIYSNTVTKDLTTPQVCRYTTL